MCDLLTDKHVEFSQSLSVALHTELAIQVEAVLFEFHTYLQKCLYNTKEQVFPAYRERHKLHLLYASVISRKYLISKEESAQEILQIIHTASLHIRHPLEGHSLIAASLVDLLLDELVPLSFHVTAVWLPGAGNFEPNAHFTDYIRNEVVRPHDFTGLQTKLQSKNVQLEEVIEGLASLSVMLHFPHFSSSSPKHLLTLVSQAVSHSDLTVP